MADRLVYRPQALERLATPGDVDRLMTVVSARYGLALLALAGLCAGAVVWGFVGRVPETVDGTGVLVNPGRVRPVQALAAGQLVDVRVRPGQEVKAGEVLAVMNNPELREQLRSAKARLTELRKLDESQRTMEATRLEQEQALLAEQEQSLGEAVKAIGDLAEKALARSETLTRVQRERLQEVHEKSRPLGEALRKQLDSVRSLAGRGLATAEQVTQAESAALQASVQASDLEAKLAEVDLKDADARQAYFQQRYRVSELSLQMRELRLRLTRLKQDSARGASDRALQLREQEDRVGLLQAQSDDVETVKSPWAGRVLELAAQPGQVVAAGARLGTVEADDGRPAESLRVLAYLPLRHGKRVRPGMQALVTPSTVQRERFGSIVGTVTRVAAFPTTQEAAASAVGSPELVHALAQAGGVIEVEVEPQRADTPSGFRWTSAGAPVRFSAGTSASVRVTVEERAPVTYAVPLLRGLIEGTDEGP